MSLRHFFYQYNEETLGNVRYIEVSGELLKLTLRIFSVERKKTPIDNTRPLVEPFLVWGFF